MNREEKTDFNRFRFFEKDGENAEQEADEERYDRIYDGLPDDIENEGTVRKKIDEGKVIGDKERLCYDEGSEKDLKKTVRGDAAAMKR